MLKLADLARFEIHGPPAEIEKLKEPLAALKPCVVHDYRWDRTKARRDRAARAGEARFDEPER
jgi:hypothetical protein